MSRTLELRGLEVNNLLSWLALLGLLRALDRVRPAWHSKARWNGPPWRAWLDVGEDIDEALVATAAVEGIEGIAAAYDVDGRKNVNFTPHEFNAYARRMADGADTAMLAAAMAVQCPLKRDGNVQSGPLVMMFGQGHQDFLTRLVAIPQGDLPARLRKLKHPPDLRSPSKIEEALFAPWSRSDDADAFRWDPEEDQRYALRFDDPSRAGAAPTVQGANRLAAIGFLSLPSFPGLKRASTRSVRRGRVTSFMWPIWRQSLSLAAIEQLLAHPGVISGDLDTLTAYGVVEVYEARRISNGKFLNVARAKPVIVERSP